MKVIFGTTNKRKIEDLNNIIEELNLDLKILSMNDIGWNLGEIEETGNTLEENSLIKAKAIYNFCLEHDIKYPIITDDAGLFVDCLNGEPGIYTARYADDEIEKDVTLPKYQCIIKLLRNMENKLNRDAKYRCVVTYMYPNGSYFQEVGESNGYIANEILGELKKPYFYAIFILNEYNKVFSELSKDELKETYRYSSLRKVIKKSFCNE